MNVFGWVIAKVQRLKYHFKKLPTKYVLDGFELNVGEGHTISRVRDEFAMYDRFIPYLGELADKMHNKRWIIDIGANVGDTVAGLVKHTESNILCVEPSEYFFSLLEENVEKMGVYSKRIRLYRALIASKEKENKVFALKQTGETATRSNEIPGEGISTPTYTINTLLAKTNIELEDVAIIKVDTDGYDSECILSLGEELKRVSPVLYWENEMHTNEQHDKYVFMIEYLVENGYNDFFVFDNFGNYFSRVDADAMKDIADYLMRIEHKHTARTMYYVDVLACKSNEIEIVKGIIKKYISAYK